MLTEVSCGPDALQSAPAGTMLQAVFQFASPVMLQCVQENLRVHPARVVVHIRVATPGKANSCKGHIPSQRANDNKLPLAARSCVRTPIL